MSRAGTSCGNAMATSGQFSEETRAAATMPVPRGVNTKTEPVATIARMRTRWEADRSDDP